MRSPVARTAEMLVRVLPRARDSFNGEVLIHIFNNTSDDSLRFAIFNTAVLTSSDDIKAWLDSLVGDQYWSSVIYKLQK